MRRMVVTCQDGSKYECELEDGDRLEVTKAGKVRFIQAEFKDASVIKLASPAVSLDELIAIDGGTATA